MLLWSPRAYVHTCTCIHKCTTGTHTAPYCHLHLSPGHPPTRSHRGPRGKQEGCHKPGLSQSLFPPHLLTFLCISVYSMLMRLPKCIYGLYHPALTKLILQGSEVTYKIPANKLQTVLLSQREKWPADEFRTSSSSQVTEMEGRQGSNHSKGCWNAQRTKELAAKPWTT